MAQKMCCEIRVPTGGYAFDIQRTDIASPLQTITIPAGAYYLCEDASAVDLAHTIETLVQASHVDLAAFACSTYTDGRFYARMGIPGQTATITWTTTLLRDWLRYTGAATNIAFAPTYGARQAMYVWYSSRSMRECRFSYDVRRAQSISDGGDVETHYYGGRPRLIVAVQHPGGPYSAAWGDYHAMRALWADGLSLGRTTRIYRDLFVTTPYAEQSNPLGYSVGVCVEPADAFIPEPVSAGWYDHWRADFVFQMASL